MAVQSSTVYPETGDNRRFRTEEKPPEVVVETTYGVPKAPRADRVSSAKWVIMASLMELLGGAGAMTLAIIGFSGLVPAILASIGVLVLGGTFFVYGGMLAAQSRSLASSVNREMLPGGITVASGLEFLAGVIGVTLGILALIGFVPAILGPCAIIAFGGALLFEAGLIYRLSDLTVRPETKRSWLRPVAWLNSTIQFVVGAGSITLGIIALVGVAPLILTLVPVLVIGASMLFCGTLGGLSMTRSLRG